jgi:hypothetical protein
MHAYKHTLDTVLVKLCEHTEMVYVHYDPTTFTLTFGEQPSQQQYDSRQEE